MTIKTQKHELLVGMSTDAKPVNVLAGTQFHALDTRADYMFDGINTWYTIEPKYYADSRVAIAISNTSTVTWSGTQFTKSGEKLVQWVIENGNSTDDVTRTMYIYKGTTATVFYTSTATTDGVTSVRVLSSSEGPIFDGTFDIRWVLSAVSGTVTTDYYTLYWSR